MELVVGDFAARTRRVFINLKAVCEAAGGSLIRYRQLDIFMTVPEQLCDGQSGHGDLFPEPYPARAAVGVAALPKGGCGKWMRSWWSP